VSDLARRGRLVDWATQRWVRATGRRVTWSEFPWLAGPTGDVDVIGTDFFHRYAERQDWSVIESGASRGLLEKLADLAGPTCKTDEVHREIADFYECTSEYTFDVWSEWSNIFKPFGGMLSSVFSQRLEQLNVPLSPLDTRLGITSKVLTLVDRCGRRQNAAWVRQTVATGRALYVGSYTTCRVPGFNGVCIKVAFPLPNGYALVIMRPESHDDGSLTVRSAGKRFGDPGFYFVVQGERESGCARYVSSLKESIHVFADSAGELRADHDLQLWGIHFLRLHYRMRRDGRADSALQPSVGLAGRR
jgi:hypothetical protein